ncbi:MAG: 1-deoxy-D-xylulose-5-phosphate synthase [Cellulosilyticaceae bacterium]
MLKKLSKIKNIEDLKQLPPTELPALAKDIRKFLVQSIARTGGHLSSNLGVVELTMALHYVFDSPKDKIVWDVGHQAYVHKLLTGRRAGFKNLRKSDGMSGFPKRHESEHDAFETGHSSTSISAALGMAVARDLAGENNHVIAVIGDGALTGGMAFEALNNAGRGNTNLIVILNDNEMSISENVGGMSKYLNRLRSAKGYIKVKEDVESVLNQIPVVGDTLVETARRTKEGVKSFFMQNTLFEELGITYLGPINGHSFEDLIDILENAKEMNGPVLIHVKTKKGKGYAFAEQDPSSFHGVSPFDVATGKKLSTHTIPTFSDGFSDAIVKIAKENDKVLAITAAMREGTGLLEFSHCYPKRFFDVGIAEQHAVTFAAGLASQGYRPVIAVYSSFLQRAYDQVLHDVALQNLPVIFAVDRAGLVGEDGSTHQGIFDIAYLSNIPNMTILSPKSPEEIEGALKLALEQEGPVAIRYPRGYTSIDTRFHIDYAEDVHNHTLYKGKDIAILATGKMVENALEVREALLAHNIDLAVIEEPMIWPLDTESLDNMAKAYSNVFTLEDHVLTGGFGSKVASYLKVAGHETKVHNFAYQTGIVEHGDIKNLLIKEKMSTKDICESILQHIGREKI